MVLKITISMEFSVAQQVKECGVVTAEARVTAVVRVQSLAWEVTHAAGAAKKN